MILLWSLYQNQHPSDGCQPRYLPNAIHLLSCIASRFNAAISTPIYITNATTNARHGRTLSDSTLPHQNLTQLQVRRTIAAEMARPTHASSPQSPTPHNPRSTVREAKTTIASEPQKSFRPDELASATSQNTQTRQSHRRSSIVWQTPNVVLSNVPTRLSTVTRSLLPTDSRTSDLLSTISGFQASIATTENKIPTTATITSATPALLQPSQDVLPDWPPILTIFLLSFLVMAWVVTVILYLATFPERVAWLDRLLRRRAGSNTNRESSGYNSNSDTDEREEHSLRLSGYSDSTKATRQPDSEQGIATSVAVGLGILLDESPYTPRLRRPRSFDPESLETPARAHNDSAIGTAPLPSSRSFSAISPAMKSRPDLQKRTYRHADSETNDRREIGTGKATRGAENRGLAAVLESVNAVIDFVAGRLGKLASDRVVGRAEDGLLLPVRDDEREPPGGLMGDC